MIQFKNFDNGDWQCYSGAERFSADQPPMIAELAVGGFPACAIIDKTGLAITWEDDINNESIEMHSGMERAALVVVKLETEMTLDALRALGMKLL